MRKHLLALCPHSTTGDTACQVYIQQIFMSMLICVKTVHLITSVKVQTEELGTILNMK